MDKMTKIRTRSEIQWWRVRQICICGSLALCTLASVKAGHQLTMIYFLPLLALNTLFMYHASKKDLRKKKNGE